MQREPIATCDETKISWESKRFAMSLLSFCFFIVLILFSAYVSHKGDRPSDFGLFMIVGTVFLIGLAGLLSLAYSLAGIGDPRAPLALPEGSIRGILALGLLAVFISTAAFLFTGLSKSNIVPIETIKEFPNPTDIKEIKAAKDTTNIKEMISNKGIEQALVYIKENSVGPFYFLIDAPDNNGITNVHVLTKVDPQAAQDMAKLVFVAVSTALSTITGFYFGSGTASTATKQANAAALARATASAAGPNNPAAIQNLLRSATEDEAAAEKACQEAASTDERLGVKRPTDTQYLQAVKDVGDIPKAAQDALADVKAKAAAAEKKLADKSGATDPDKLKATTEAARQASEDLQKSTDILRAIRDKAIAANVYIQKMAPPPPAPTTANETLAQTAAAIVQRSVDARKKYGALGDDANAVLEQTVKEAGDGASDAVKTALNKAADAWTSMQSKLQTLASDAERVQAAATTAAASNADAAAVKSASDTIATFDTESKTAAQKFDADYDAFTAARDSIHSQAAKG